MARLWRTDSVARGFWIACLLCLPVTGCGSGEPVVDIAASKKASAEGGLQFPSPKPSKSKANSKVRLDPNYSVHDPAQKKR